MTEPIRILTAVPICDGHDSAILTINLELMRHGVEVIYLGYNRSARDIARAAVQEDVRAVGISSYNGGHIEFFSEVLALLRKWNAAHIGVFGGGGGTITESDAAIMQRRGVDRIFFAGTRFAEMIRFVKERYGAARRPVDARGHCKPFCYAESRSRGKPSGACGWNHADREAWERPRSSTSWSCDFLDSIPSGVSRFFHMIQVRPARARCWAIAQR